MPGYKNAFNLNADLNDKKPIKSNIEERAREYRHSLVTSQDAHPEAILAHIEGSSYVVDYYAQMKAFDEEVKEYDPNQSRLNQQYHVIYNLELKLQNQDPVTEDRTNKVMMGGTATIYAGVIPNQGDVMIADIGAGMAGRLNVKSVEKKQYIAHTVYEIEYELIDFMDKETKLQHLESFVVKRSVFNRDLLTYGNDPVVLQEDYNDAIKAQDVEKELIDDYLKEFFSNELCTFLVPDYGAKPTYDPYIVEAFREVVNVDEHPLMQRLKTLNLNELREVYSMSIWPVLLRPEVNQVKNIWKRAAPVAYDKFHLNPKMASFRYSGFAQCISPIEDLPNVDYYQGYAQRPKQGALMTTQQVTSILAGGFGTAVGSQLEAELKNQNKVCCHHLVHYHEANSHAVGEDSARYLDLVHKWVRATGHWSSCSICGGCDTCCCCEDCDNPTNGCPPEDPYAYVLPNDFWNKGVLDDLFTSFVRRYLNGDRIPLRELIKYAENRLTLTRRQRFYRMMVLLIILRSSIRSI